MTYIGLYKKLLVCCCSNCNIFHIQGKVDKISLDSLVFDCSIIIVICNEIHKRLIQEKKLQKQRHHLKIV